MTERYLTRIVLVLAVLAALLAAAWWLKPKRADGERWRYYRIAEASPSSPRAATAAQFVRLNGAHDLDSLALLPGSLLFLPKKAETPLFGHREVAPGSPVDVIVTPGECLLVRGVRFTAPAGDGGGALRVLIAVEDQQRRAPVLDRLRTSVPAQCATTYAPECIIGVWAEARPKKCD